MSPAPAPLRLFRSPTRRFSGLCRPLAACLLLLGAVLPLAAQTAGAPGTPDAPFNLASALAFADSAAYTLLLINTSQTGDPAADAANETVLVGGDRAGFMQLLGDGTPDSQFDMDVPLFGSTARIVYTAVPELPVTATSAILLGGQFGRTTDQINNNKPGLNILRLNVDGTPDPTFNVGAGANGFVTAILPQANPADATLPNVIVVGGQFSQFNALTHNHIVRLTDTGAIDPTFNPTLDIDTDVLSLAAQTSPATGLPNGQILVAGTFGQVDGAAHTKLARLNFNGTVDSTFNPVFDQRVVIVTTQPDGKILVGGDFLTVNGKPASHVARLNFDGTLDTGFVANVSTLPSGLSAPPAVYVIRVLPDGRIFLGGNFAKINGVTRNFLGRVNANGTLDGFDPGSSLPNPVQSLAIQPDNKLVLGLSRSNTVSGTRPPTLVRLYGDPVVAAPATPTVSVSAPVSIATRATPGQLTFTRTGTDLTTSFGFFVKAGLTGASDYKVKTAAGTVVLKPGQPRTFAVVFPPGGDTASLFVVPTKGFVKNGGPAETISYKLLPASSPGGYVVSGPAKVKITLQPN